MKYDRDEVKRLERELEINGDNRFRPYRIGEEAPKPAPDLLSIAGQLAEAARKYHAAMQDTVCNGEQLRDLHTALGEELAAWDAALKGRK